MRVPHTYLDYNSTSPVRPEVAEAVAAAMRVTGNPSSVHQAGRTARSMVEAAREKVANLLGARPEHVTFTSGGTEANALALSPRTAKGRLVVSSVEHPSILAGGRFAASEVETIPVDGKGVVDLDWLDRRLAREPRVGMVSVMAANNETGALQPVAQIAQAACAAGAVVHCDAVQAAGRVPVDIAALGAHTLTISAHKIGGPQGVGALVRTDEVGRTPEPVFRGGGQERSLRAGTENVAGIVGFGVAAELAAAELPLMRQIARKREALEGGVSAVSPEATIFSAGAPRVANTSCFAVPEISAEKVIIALDLEGVAVSSGSACSSGKVGPSHVLAAMDVEPHLASGAIRVSLGWASTDADIEHFLEIWRRVYGVLSQRGRERAA